MLSSSCAKKDISAPSLVEVKNQQEVVKRFLTIPENASDELKFLVNNIKNTEVQYHFLYAYVKRNGMPNWGSSESNVPIVKGGNTKTGNIASNSVLNNSPSTSGSSETYFIPLIDSVSKEVKSYIFCRKNIGGKINYKTYNKQAILSSTAKDSNDVKVKGVMLSVFAHFEMKINNKNSLSLSFPYNYNLNNVELKFSSSQISGANNITKTATSDGQVKKYDNVGCDYIITISGSGFSGSYTPSQIYGDPNYYPPNWIEDPNNPWLSQGLWLDLIGMPGNTPNPFIDDVYLSYPTPPFTWTFSSDDGTSYTDNNPSLEPFFKFDDNDNYSTTYPKFYAMVKNLKKFVVDHPKVFSALQTYSGLSKQQIIDNLTFGNGPTVKVVELPNGVYGRFNSSISKKIIRVNAIFVRGLEQSILASTQEATAFLLGVTILHELVHLGRYKLNLSEGEYDFGYGFERDAFGVTVNDDNAGNISILYKRYF